MDQQWHDKLATLLTKDRRSETPLPLLNELIAENVERLERSLITLTLTLLFFTMRLQQSRAKIAPSNLDIPKMEALLSFASLATANHIMSLSVQPKTLVNISKLLPQISLKSDDVITFFELMEELEESVFEELEQE